MHNTVCSCMDSTFLRWESSNASLAVDNPFLLENGESVCQRIDQKMTKKKISAYHAYQTLCFGILFITLKLQSCGLQHVHMSLNLLSYTFRKLTSQEWTLLNAKMKIELFFYIFFYLLLHRFPIFCPKLHLTTAFLLLFIQRNPHRITE